MRMLSFAFSLVLAVGFVGGVYAADKPGPGKSDEKPADQTGSLTGVIKIPGAEAPKGTCAELHQNLGGGDTTFFLFADGSTEKKLKDLAKNGATATVAGTITEKGYRVSSISNIVKPK